MVTTHGNHSDQEYGSVVRASEKSCLGFDDGKVGGPRETPDSFPSLGSQVISEHSLHVVQISKGITGICMTLHVDEEGLTLWTELL